MKIRRATKVLTVFLSLALVGLAVAGFFLRSETGRLWAQREAIAWIEREYGVSIQYQSLVITETALGWDIALGQILWKREPNTPGVNQDFPGQPIEVLHLTVNPISFFFKQQPITSIVIRGLILRPKIDADGIFLQGAAWRLNQESLAKLIPGSSDLGQINPWPSLRVEDALIELANDQTTDISSDKGFTTIRVAGEWSATGGLRDIELVSARLDLVKLTEQAHQLGILLARPVLGSTLEKDLRFLERGWIEALQVHCLEGLDCKGSVNLKNLQWKEKGYLPGLNELSARVEFNHKQFQIIIPHTERSLTWSKVYRQPVAINLFGTRIKGEYGDDFITLDIPQTKIDWNQLPFEAEAQLKLSFKNMDKSYLQLRLHNSSAPWDKVIAVLPNQILGHELVGWLSQRIRKGQTRNLLAEFKGPIMEFPFAVKDSGIFSLDADFSGMQLAYSDEWPVLDRCQGHVHIKGAKLGIDKLACQSHALKADQGRLEVPDFLAANPHLKLDLEAQGDIEASLDFLGKTPLQAIRQVVSALGISASLQKTHISMDIPLKRSAAQAGLQLEGETLIPLADLVLPRQLLRGTLRQIKLRFDQNGLQKLTADLVQSNQKSQLLVRRDPSESYLDLELKTLSGASGLGLAFRLSPARQPQRIEGRFSGLTLYQGAAHVLVDSLVWQGLDSPFQVKGQASVQDFGKISPMLGLGEDYEGGRGTINFDLSLPGNLSLTSPAKLNGSLDFDLEDGSIHKLSGTPMAFINIANLKVFGITSHNLHYPFLKGKLLFDRGSLSTDNSSIGLGALEIQAKGSIHYPSDSLKVDLTIIPDLGSPVASLAIGLWNPLVGLSLYGYSKIQNKASDSRLNRLASQSYRMKGSMENPEISLINLLQLKEILPWTNSNDKAGASP